jgi:branched-chain amino acid transport system substrate-binding protein
MRKGFWISTALLLILSLLVGGGIACDEESEPGVKTVKMASLMTLSGPVAGWGVPLDEGAKFAVAEINEQGGFEVGDDLYKIDLKSFDEQYRGDVAATMAAQIVDEGRHFVFGPLSFDGERSATPIFQEADTFVCGISAAEYLTIAVDEGYTYYWNCSYPNVAWLGAMLKGNYELSPDVETIVQINADDDFGRSAAAASRVTTDQLGLQLEDVFFTPGTTDFYPILTPVVDENPDVIFTALTQAGDMLLVIKQARELGYEGEIWAGESRWEDMVSIGGLENIEGGRFVNADFTSEVWPQDVRDVADRWRERFGTEMEFTAFIGYEVIRIYVQAIQEAGSIDPEEVLEVFDDPNWRFTFWGDTQSEMSGVETYGARRQTEGFQGLSQIVNGEIQQLTLTKMDIP